MGVYHVRTCSPALSTLACCVALERCSHQCSALSLSLSSAIFEPPYEPIAKEAEAIMGRTEHGPTEPFQEPRPVHAAPLTPAEETAAVWPGADFDDPKASVDDTPPQVLQQNAASGTDCEAITDIELWLDCEMNKRGQPSPPPPPYVPPPPPPPVISPDPAEIDCDSTTTTIDEWCVHSACALRCTDVPSMLVEGLETYILAAL